MPWNRWTSHIQPSSRAIWVGSWSTRTYTNHGHQRLFFDASKATFRKKMLIRSFMDFSQNSSVVIAFTSDIHLSYKIINKYDCHRFLSFSRDKTFLHIEVVIAEIADMRTDSLIFFGSAQSPGHGTVSHPWKPKKRQFTCDKLLVGKRTNTLAEESRSEKAGYSQVQSWEVCTHAIPERLNLPTVL